MRTDELISILGNDTQSQPPVNVAQVDNLVVLRPHTAIDVGPRPDAASGLRAESPHRSHALDTSGRAKSTDLGAAEITHSGGLAVGKPVANGREVPPSGWRRGRSGVGRSASGRPITSTPEPLTVRAAAERSRPTMVGRQLSSRQGCRAHLLTPNDAGYRALCGRRRAVVLCARSTTSPPPVRADTWVSVALGCR